MKLTYYGGHTMRKLGNCLEKEMMQGTMPGARRRGRPRTAWTVNIKTWTAFFVEESIRTTEDRYTRRKYVNFPPSRRCDSTSGFCLRMPILLLLSTMWPTPGSGTAKEQTELRTKGCLRGGTFRRRRTPVAKKTFERIEVYKPLSLIICVTLSDVKLQYLT